MSRFTACAIFVLALLTASAAHGHRVSIYAYAEGDTIHTESGFSKGKPVVKGTVEVYDHEGKLLLTGHPNENGEFSFPIPAEARAKREDLTIVIQAGEGHRGEWSLTADDYLGPAPDSEGAAPEPQAPAETVAATAVAAPAGGAVCLDEKALARIVEAAVDKKIAPMKRALIESAEAGPGLVEIFGGLGWLLGLAGIAAYFKSKNR